MLYIHLYTQYTPSCTGPALHARERPDTGVQEPHGHRGVGCARGGGGGRSEGLQCGGK